MDVSRDQSIAHKGFHQYYGMEFVAPHKKPSPFGLVLLDFNMNIPNFFKCKKTVEFLEIKNKHVYVRFENKNG